MTCRSNRDTCTVICRSVAADVPTASPAAVKSALQAAGTSNWATSTDPDSTHEPPLNVSDI